MDVKSYRPTIRWNETAEVFLIEYGNIRMGLTRQSAEILAHDMLDAVNDLPHEHSIYCMDASGLRCRITGEV
jgi:hypothetical protein